MPHPTDNLVRKLESIGDLTGGDAEILRNMPLRLVTLERGQEAASDGQTSEHTCLLVEGLLHRQKVSVEGSRQILSFHPPGDIPDLHGLHLKKMDHSLVATTDSKVAYIAHSDMQKALHGSLSLLDLMWRETLIDSARFRAWMLMMGQEPAGPRMAHLFCECWSA